MEKRKRVITIELPDATETMEKLLIAAVTDFLAVYYITPVITAQPLEEEPEIVMEASDGQAA